MASGSIAWLQVRAYRQSSCCSVGGVDQRAACEVKRSREGRAKQSVLNEVGEMSKENAVKSGRL